MDDIKRKLLRIVLWLMALGVACYAALIGLVYHWEVNVPKANGYDDYLENVQTAYDRFMAKIK